MRTAKKLLSLMLLAAVPAVFFVWSRPAAQPRPATSQVGADFFDPIETEHDLKRLRRERFEPGDGAKTGRAASAALKKDGDIGLPPATDLLSVDERVDGRLRLTIIKMRSREIPILDLVLFFMEPLVDDGWGLYRDNLNKSFGWSALFGPGPRSPGGRWIAFFAVRERAGYFDENGPINLSIMKIDQLSGAFD